MKQTDPWSSVYTYTPSFENAMTKKLKLTLQTTVPMFERLVFSAQSNKPRTAQHNDGSDQSNLEAIGIAARGRLANSSTRAAAAAV